MISVVMPVYNGESYLPYSIQSILNQTYKDFEFIIINDGSKDNSEKIILSFNDKRIKYFKCEHRGISKTLNYGLSKSSCDIIARMDADDIAVPTRFEEQLNFLNSNPDYDVVSSWYTLFKNKKIKYVIKTVETDFQIKQRLMLHSEIVHPGVMYRKGIVEKYNGYSTDGVEDYELWLKLKNEAKFYNIQKVLTFYRISDSSSTITKSEEFKSKKYLVQQPYYENLSTNFHLNHEHEENKIRGWREYFYGDKVKARKFWRKNNTRSLADIRLYSAIITTYFSNYHFEKFIKSNIKLKLKYYLNYFSKQYKELRNNFKELIKVLEADLNIHQ